MTEKTLDPEATKRSDLWKASGYPITELKDDLKTTLKTYRERYVFHGQAALERVQQVCRVLFCPNCIEKADNTHLKATRLVVRHEEDPLRTFAYLGHASCLRCGFEEYYPVEKQLHSYSEAVGGMGIAQSACAPVSQGATPPFAGGQLIGGTLTQSKRQLLQQLLNRNNKTP